MPDWFQWLVPVPLLIGLNLAFFTIGRDRERQRCIELLYAAGKRHVNVGMMTANLFDDFARGRKPPKKVKVGPNRKLS